MTANKTNKQDTTDSDSSDLEREFMANDSLAVTPRRSNDQEHQTSRSKSNTKRRLNKNLTKLLSQRFIYNNGFISSKDTPGLVLTVPDSSDPSANVCEVFLARKNEDSVNQRWVYRPDDGLIMSRLPSRSHMCLSVRLPVFESTGFDANQLPGESICNHGYFYDQAPVVVQPFIDYSNGNAQQRWRIDDETGFIYAFSSRNNTNNLEITAANKSGICTYYVTQEREISQPV